MTNFNWISVALGFGIGILMSGLVLLLIEWRIIYINLPFDLSIGFLMVCIGIISLLIVYWKEKESGFS